MTVPALAIAVMWIAAILAVTAGFFFAVRRWAGKTADDRPDASELLTKFRELHASGELSDSEYRNIKSTLAPLVESEAAALASGEAAADAAALREVAAAQAEALRSLAAGGEQRADADRDDA
ncbi:MAG: hypothetical protein AAF805_08510 [Planctomycetota bacterium]